MPARNLGVAKEDVSTSALSTSEQDLLDETMRHCYQDIREMGTQVLYDKHREYMEEIRFAARVAKAQFAQNFGGQQASASQFVMTPIHPSYFGYSDWSQAPEASAQTTTTWIDSSAPDLLNGNADEPVRVGEQAVHVILGLGSHEDSPVENRYKWYTQREPRTVVNTEETYRQTDIGIQFLEAPLVLPEDNEFRAEFWSPAAGSTYPFLHGYTFVKGQPARRPDPTTYLGSDVSNSILAEQ